MTALCAPHISVGVWGGRRGGRSGKLEVLRGPCLHDWPESFSPGLARAGLTPLLVATFAGSWSHAPAQRTRPPGRLPSRGPGAPTWATRRQAPAHPLSAPLLVLPAWPNYENSFWSPDMQAFYSSAPQASFNLLAHTNGSACKLWGVFVCLGGRHDLALHTPLPCARNLGPVPGPPGASFPHQSVETRAPPSWAVLRPIQAKCLERGPARSRDLPRGGAVLFLLWFRRVLARTPEPALLGWRWAHSLVPSPVMLKSGIQ